jgi:hypothetical protein
MGSVALAVGWMPDTEQDGVLGHSGWRRCRAWRATGIKVVDGVGAGIFSIIAVIADDLMHGTGRFNLVEGFVALSVGVGAGLANLTLGFVIQWFRYPTSERVPLSRDDCRRCPVFLCRFHARNPACRGERCTRRRTK